MITDNLIAGVKSAEGKESLQSVNPTTRTILSEKFPIATAEEINTAATSANNAWKIYKRSTGRERALFLRTIALEIEDLGDVLIDRAMAESGLPEGRIRGERGRTCNQLRLFADHVEEGSWVDAIIDEAIPDREPLPRVDIRKMSIALGPVAVFTASNFPLAFSTAGGDTASALAAGCPVIVKAHPSHLGTNALVSEAITNAAQKCYMPSGIFSSIHGSIETGQLLVQHPLVKAVGFTGSYNGGKALFDIANSRIDPIPVYAEMGSNNPIFLLQDKLNKEYQDLATSLANSVNLGAGQFCTNPGILVFQKSEASESFLQALKVAFAALQSATMLNKGIFNAYRKGTETCINSKGVGVLYEHNNNNGQWAGEPMLAQVSAKLFIENKTLQEEVFGPFTLAVICDSASEVKEVANNLNGQLTASIMGAHEEIGNTMDLVDVLSQKAGRVIFNGLPTGVEVCSAMHHGGPFPSTTNAMFTSVGMDAVKRFVRPVAFQNTPNTVLPMELKAGNPLNIWRTVNGEKTKK